MTAIFNTDSHLFWWLLNFIVPCHVALKWVHFSCYVFEYIIEFVLKICYDFLQAKTRCCGIELVLLFYDRPWFSVKQVLEFAWQLVSTSVPLLLCVGYSTPTTYGSASKQWDLLSSSIVFIWRSSLTQRYVESKICNILHALMGENFRNIEFFSKGLKNTKYKFEKFVFHAAEEREM